MEKEVHALVYTAPSKARIEPVALSASTNGMVEIETTYSALSRGTERLIFEGRVPEAEWERMRAPLQEGNFPFPVRYGYATVGRVVAGSNNLLGRDVFCLAPHQSRLLVPDTMVLPVPTNVPPERAVLAANMETALNALWDAGRLPGRILIVGAGLLGWLIAALLSRLPDISVTVTDIRTQPSALADDFGVSFVSADEVPQQTFDLTFHTSASETGLQTAVDALSIEGRVIELSWYGDRSVSISLGANFHANRLQIIASQVGHVAPSRRSGTSHRDRLARALTHLSDTRLDRLITEEVPFCSLADELPRLLAPGAPGIATRVRYEP